MDDEHRPAIARIVAYGFAVTALPLGSFTASYDLLDGLTGDEAMTFLRELDRPTDARVHAHAFAVETADQLIMIDAGMGAGSALDGLAGSLADAALADRPVDAVVLTHLHPDHANGLLDDSFGDAPVYVPAAEVAFARDPAAIASAGPFVAKDYARAADVLDAVGARLVEFSPTSPDGLLPGGLSAVDLPGHSPGHTGYRLDAGDAAILFVGDLIHFPDIQGRCPHVSVRPDFDARRAAGTRREVLDRARISATTLAGAHLGSLGFRRVAGDERGRHLV